MIDIKKLSEKVVRGYNITKEEALEIYLSDYSELLSEANKIREIMCGDSFDLCTIINGKSGRCSENCKYCAQSVHFKTGIEEYPLLSKKEVVDNAMDSYNLGILRFSIVTSGKGLSNNEIDVVCESYKEIREKCNIKLCASHGLLTFEQFKKLKNSGVTRYHNNLETSRNFFHKICTTHTYDDKVNSIKNAVKAGLQVCSGGILGLGESVEDRIDMILDLKSLGVKSIPVNILKPILGTALENNKTLEEEEILRSIAMFRFIAPDAAIRLAGGRAVLNDKGRLAIRSGANAAISGDMLTTLGISLKDDMKMINDCGYKVSII
ncbi:MAG: biotin synthase BioB [Clostridium sp.]